MIQVPKTALFLKTLAYSVISHLLNWENKVVDFTGFSEPFKKIFFEKIAKLPETVFISLSPCVGPIFRD